MFELNEHTRAILCPPNFACATIAARLRTLGHPIATKAEDERAATIHFLLTVYETHGDNWAEAANVISKGEAKPATPRKHSRLKPRVKPITRST